MEMAMELEDDLFFADLTKRTSLLIMDDDDDHQDPFSSCNPASLQTFSWQFINQIRFPLMCMSNLAKEKRKKLEFSSRNLQHRQGKYTNAYKNSQTRSQADQRNRKMVTQLA